MCEILWHPHPPTVVLFYYNVVLCQWIHHPDCQQLQPRPLWDNGIGNEKWWAGDNWDDEGAPDLRLLPCGWASPHAGFLQRWTHGERQLQIHLLRVAQFHSAPPRRSECPEMLSSQVENNRTLMIMYISRNCFATVFYVPSLVSSGHLDNALNLLYLIFKYFDPSVTLSF